MIDLRCGDCLELMKDIPDKSIDLILTDVPYGISKDSNFKTMGRSGLDFGEWDKNVNHFAWLNEIPRILKKDGSVIIFESWKEIGEVAKYCESLGLVIKDIIRWEKANPMPRNRDRRYVSDIEFAVWLTNKNAKWTFNRFSETYERPLLKSAIPNGKKRVHPTQKPVEILEKLLLLHTNKDDVILDCFMGSGSTGVACINTNRNFIGIELDENYFNIAKERIEKAAEDNKEAV